jgi:hypothetical protein
MTHTSCGLCFTTVECHSLFQMSSQPKCMEDTWLPNSLWLPLVLHHLPVQGGLMQGTNSRALWLRRRLRCCHNQGRLRVQDEGPLHTLTLTHRLGKKAQRCGGGACGGRGSCWSLDRRHPVGHLLTCWLQNHDASGELLLLLLHGYRATMWR